MTLELCPSPETSKPAFDPDDPLPAKQPARANSAAATRKSPEPPVGKITPFPTVGNTVSGVLVGSAKPQQFAGPVGKRSVQTKIQRTIAGRPVTRGSSSPETRGRALRPGASDGPGQGSASPPNSRSPVRTSDHVLNMPAGSSAGSGKIPGASGSNNVYYAHVQEQGHDDDHEGFQVTTGAGNSILAPQNIPVTMANAAARKKIFRPGSGVGAPRKKDVQGVRETNSYMPDSYHEKRGDGSPR